MTRYRSVTYTLVSALLAACSSGPSAESDSHSSVAPPPSGDELKCPLQAATVCSGKCTNTSSDTKNCGGCGNVCPSGYSCITGACEEVLATALDEPSDVKVDSKYIYWTASTIDFAATDAGAIVKMPLAGGTPTTLASGLFKPLTMAIDATSAYWINYGPPTGATGQTGAVLKVGLNGGAVTTLTAGQAVPQFLAIDSSNVYFTAEDANANGIVAKVPTGGGSVTTIATFVGDRTYGLAVAPNGDLYVALNATIAQVATTGSSVTTLASAPPGEFTGDFVLTDGANVYFTTAPPAGADAGSSLMKIPLGGGVTTTLASGLPVVWAMTLDATNVYMTTWAANGEILSVPVNGVPYGSSPTVLARSQVYPTGIAATGTNLYWADFGSATATTGEIVKLASK